MLVDDEMNEQSSEAPFETAENADGSSGEILEQPAAGENASDDAEATVAGKRGAPAPLQRSYKTGTKVAAFIFFFITVGIFAVYEFLAFDFLYLPLLSSIDNIGEALGAIFGYIFGLIYTLAFAALQLPANIAAIILLKRIRGKSDKRWENVLFNVLFVLAIVMLVVTILSTVLFFGLSAVGG